VPIQPLLASESGVFTPEEIASVAAGFESVLRSLKLVDRKDPMVLMVADLTLDIAKQGERDPARLSEMVLERLSR
jgi:hypothetical protein